MQTRPEFERTLDILGDLSETQTIEAIENSTFLSEEKKQNKIAEYTKQLEVLYRKQELNIESLNKRPNDLIEENFFIDGERVTKQQFDEYTLSQKGILQEELNVILLKTNLLLWAKGMD